MTVNRQRLIAGGGVFIALVAYPIHAFAETAANFGIITFSAASVPSMEPVRGHTQGTVPLASIALEDQQGNLCVGYAESEPDHMLLVEQDVEQMTLTVNSNGGDTTLLVQSSDGRTWCSDDFGNSSDARIQLGNLIPGEYRVWVGSFDPGVRYRYTLLMN